MTQRRIYGTPKNHERREVALDDHLAASLRGWRKQGVGERLAWGASYTGTEDLLVAEDGRPALPDYVTRTFGNLTTGRTMRLNVHELRHTHATLLLREGVPVHVVAGQAPGPQGPECDPERLRGRCPG